MKKTFSALNPETLRIPFSKNLLLGAHELNEFYEKNKEHTKGGKNEKSIY